MSVLIVTKMQGDTARFSQALRERESEFVQIAGRARSAGAIHHQFGIGDGYVLIMDEWETADDFEKFFTDPDLQAFVASVGGAAGPPEVTVCTATHSADQF
jgi:quinol monooxygenase YgiN